MATVVLPLDGSKCRPLDSRNDGSAASRSWPLRGWMQGGLSRLHETNGGRCALHAARRRRWRLGQVQIRQPFAEMARRQHCQEPESVIHPDKFFTPHNNSQAMFIL